MRDFIRHITKNQTLKKFFKTFEILLNNIFDELNDFFSYTNIFKDLIYLKKSFFQTFKKERKHLKMIFFVISISMFFIMIYLFDYNNLLIQIYHRRITYLNCHVMLLN